MHQEFYIALVIHGRPMRRARGGSVALAYLRPDYFVNTNSEPVGKWITTDHEIGAYRFLSREAAETVMLLDSIKNPDRLGRYKIVTVTKVVEDGAIVSKRSFV